MIFLLFSSIICAHEAKLDFHEFDLTDYGSFRDKLQKNHFLITLSTNNSDKYQFYKSFFMDICNDLSQYAQKDINFSYVLLLDPNLNVNYDAAFYIYLPGISEKEVSIYPRLSVAFNTNKIINNCLQQAIDLRRLEKKQKSPEIARIKEELRQIAKMIKSGRHPQASQEKLLEDYNSLSDELMQYIPENKQKERKLRLQLQITPRNDRKYKRIQKEIQKEKELRAKYINKDQHDLSIHKIDKITEKEIIQALRQASEDSTLKIFTSAFVGMYHWMKAGVIHLFNATAKRYRDDL